ncbi:DUF6463 family protein [Nocardia sp. IFM 10818]
MTDLTRAAGERLSASALCPWVHRLIFAAAAVHFVWAFVRPNAWSGIVRDGVWAAAADRDSPDHFEREASVWFLIAGIALLALGSLTRRILIATGTTPVAVGWYLLAVGIPLTVIYFPLTGGWLMLVIAAIAFAAGRFRRRVRG